jgi:hypothetical protein
VLKKLTHRTFLERFGSATAVTLAPSVTGLAPSLNSMSVADAEMGPGDTHDRRWQAYKLRHEAAMAHSNQPFPSFPTNYRAVAK